MRFNLLPKENIFYQYLEELVVHAQEAAKLFNTLIAAWEYSHAAVQQLRDLEHVCDKIVHKIMIKLNKTFVTPIDREDIHNLAKKIDDLVDIIQGLSERMVLFGIQKISDELKEMASILEKTVAVVVIAIHKIKHLKKAPELLENCILINTFENQGDRIYEKALGLLFHPPMDPLEVIKWKEIYDFIELAIDKCEDIADIIWGIVVKYG